MTATRLFLRIHKWIGICLGFLVFMWLASGMVMILPFHPLVPAGFNAPTNFSAVQLSPSEALRHVKVDGTATLRVSVVGIGRRAYYLVQDDAGSTALVDGASGAVLTITPEVAESLARAALVRPRVPLRQIDELQRHTLSYPGGALPVYRVAFDDASHTIAYVSTRDGGVFADTRLRRLRQSISLLHRFGQLETVTGSRLAKVGALHLTSLIGLTLVLTGYYLTLPKRWRRRFG